MWVLTAAICLVFVLSLAWYSWLVAAFSRSLVRRGYRAARRPLDLLLGLLFSLLGIKLAASE